MALHNINFIKSPRQILTLCFVFAIAITVIIMAQDKLNAYIRHTSFYYAESLLYSCFWLIFIPFIYGQYLILKNNRFNNYVNKIGGIILPIVIHLYLFPFLVWLLSATFYYHTYAYAQVLRYTFSEHLYHLILVYSTYPLLHLFISKAKFNTQPDVNSTIQNSYLDHIIISEQNRTIKLLVSDIIYFEANSPYINIHLTNKKYLCNETLRSISEKLDMTKFIRIHKSSLVNIDFVESYVSRLNGDYDLSLSNGVTLRISRNYAADFKKAFNQSHHLTKE